jgi:hypothetical protein
MHHPFGHLYPGLVLASFFMGACAIDQAASLREAKPNQLGIANYGYMHRVNSNKAAGLTFDIGSSETFYFKATENDEVMTARK